ncbi:MAG: peptidyl-tRNA hydrolase [Clostridia bacterium]|nr:peptidyl-tRNA hydrolase [Clostridia bacterium]
MDYLLIGLGNPGLKYYSTRHNVGFLSIDYISQKLGINVNKLKFKALCGEASANGKKILLMKPQTFMNKSGEAVFEAASYYHIPPEHIIVINDDIALPSCKLRIRKSGSDGGHKGLESIIDHLKSDNFPRIKIGVSDRQNPDMDLADWVLGELTKTEKEELFKKFENIYKSVLLLFEDNIEQAMSKYNG